jgi:aminoglycoside phosphotransferase (APT) family kinase protein
MTHASAEDRDWIERTAGARIARSERATAGPSRAAWLVELAADDGRRRRIVLRRAQPGGALAGTPLTLAREATFLDAFAAAAPPIPRLLAISDARDALLLEVAADGAVATPDLDVQACALAALHALPPAPLAQAGFAEPKDAAECAALELALWRDVFDARVRRPSPLARFAFRWLGAQLPDGPVRVAPCHGGAEGFVSAGGGATALGWELAHLGDPADDLAVLTVRAHLLGTGDVAHALDVYERSSGSAIDAARLRWYQALALLRLLVLAGADLDATSRGGDAAAAVALMPLLEKRLAEVLADLAGLAVDPPQDAERFGVSADEQDRADCAELVGEAPGSAEDAARALELLAESEPPESNAALLRVLVRRADRHAALWPALAPALARTLHRPHRRGTP